MASTTSLPDRAASSAVVDRRIGQDQERQRPALGRLAQLGQVAAGYRRASSWQSDTTSPCRASPCIRSVRRRSAGIRPAPENPPGWATGVQASGTGESSPGILVEPVEYVHEFLDVGGHFTYHIIRAGFEREALD